MPLPIPVDALKALAILKDILIEAQTLEEKEEEDSDSVTALGYVQSAVDTLDSPLFSSLLDIRNQYSKVCYISLSLSSSLPSSLPPSLCNSTSI